MSIFAKAKELKNKKKGFTLVELIVVLVILAILAAILVPALTGYIDRAKEKELISNTRSAVMAAQTIADENYAKVNPGASAAVPSVDSVSALAEVKTGTISDIETEGGKISKLVYTNKGKKCTYDINATEQYKVDALAS